MRKLVFTASIVVIFLFDLTSHPRPVQAATVTVLYDANGPDAVDPCATNPPMIVCEEGTNQTPQALEIVQAAADYWSRVIGDSHSMTILFSWLDPAVSNLPDATPVLTNDKGRVTVGRVRFPPSTFTYFYDQTPELDEEFLGRNSNSNSILASGMMRPKLYRTLHPQEQAEAFFGSPLEILEVGYNGLTNTTSTGTDMLSYALHEVGHLFGLSGSTQFCSEDIIPSGYLPSPNLTGGAGMIIKAYEYAYTYPDIDPKTGKPHPKAGEQEQRLDCAHLAAGGIKACKPPPADQDTTSPEPSTMPGLSIHDCTAHQALLWQGAYPDSRVRPSIVDILAVASAKGWSQVNLPRKYSLGAGGTWDSGDTWFGGQAPSNQDDVYVVNQQKPRPITSITSANNRSARNLFISDGNRVRVTNNKLSIGRTVWLAGPDSREGPVRPIIDPPSGSDFSLGIETIPSTLEVTGNNSIVVGEALGIEPSARLRLRNGGRAQFGEVVNTGSIQGRGTLGVERSFINGTTASENGADTPASGIIRAENGLLRIVTPPPLPPESFTAQPTQPPIIVDLDGPAPKASPTTPKIHAIAGNIEIDAIVDQGIWADIRIGSGRTLRFVRNGIKQNASASPKYALRFEGGAAGATFDAPRSQFFGIVEVNGVGLFTGQTRFGNTASVRLALGGTTVGTQHDQLRFQQIAELGGTLQVALKDGFTPQSGQFFTVMTYGSRVGEFDTINLPSLPFGLFWDVQYGATALRLVATNLAIGPTEPGGPTEPDIETDVNSDGSTNFLDVLDILLHFGSCPPQASACSWDINGDGVVDDDDVLLWLENA